MNKKATLKLRQKKQEEEGLDIFDKPESQRDQDEVEI